MIVFAHGYDVTPDTYAALLDSWVKAGFVVAAPFFPDEDRSGVAAQHGVNTEDDLWNEPADLTFVTRQILDDSSTASARCPIVHGLIRASELALAGHSDGATVVAMLSYAHGKDPYGRTFQQLRAGLDFRATIVLSGEVDMVDTYGPLSPDPSLLLVQSVADQCNVFHNGVQLYAAIHQASKWFLELRTAHHLPPFDGADVAAFDVVAHASIRFLQVALEGARPQSGLVDYGDVNPAVAVMFHGGNGPAITAPAILESCGPN
jgi:predicted dienelactone hydrolase